MTEERFLQLTNSATKHGTAGHGRANTTLKRLRALVNFANDRFGTEDEPLIKTNPVSRLTQNRSWHRIYPRQNIILDDKLKVWYNAVGSLQHEVARDFLIFLLLTGMRFGETRKLKWSHVDFDTKILTVPRELTKGDREHRLPLSDFLIALLRKRYIYRKNSEWVFQSAHLKNKHLSAGAGISRRVSAISGIKFTYHDLRRTFLTMGEKLNVPLYVLKRLVNHSVSNDMTGRYLIFDMDRLRAYMTEITNAFVEKFGINDSKTPGSKLVSASDMTEFCQMHIHLQSGPII